MVNGGPAAVPFIVQAGDGRWRVVIDTARPPPEDIALDGARSLTRPSHVVEARSVVVLERDGAS